MESRAPRTFESRAAFIVPPHRSSGPLAPRSPVAVTVRMIWRPAARQGYDLTSLRETLWLTFYQKQPINNVPLDEGTGGVHVRTEGMPSTEGAALLDMTFAGGDDFEVMGIPLLKGRTFTRDEAVSVNTSVIISRSAAEKLWPAEEPVGQRIRPRLAGQDTLAFTVVGVVGDVKQDDWRDPGEAIVYFPLTGPTPSMWAMGSPATS